MPDKRLPIPGKDLGNWGAILNDYLLVSHNANGTLKTDALLVNKASVGLGNVDNTSDTLKPVSAAAQTALSLKADITSTIKTNAHTDIVPSGVPYAELYNSGSQATFHLTNTPGFSGAYILGVGKDVTGVGLQVSNKASQPGAIFTNTPAVSDNVSPALQVAKQSPYLASQFFSQVAAGDLVSYEQIIVPGAAGSTLSKWVTYGSHLAGDISAADGTFRWIDPMSISNVITLSDLTTGHRARLVATDNSSVKAYVELGVTPELVNSEVAFWRPTGDGRYWSQRFVTDAGVLSLQTSTAQPKGNESYGTIAQFQEGAMGFYGVAPVGKGLATTDLGQIMSDVGFRSAGNAYAITTSGPVNLTNARIAKRTGTAISSATPSINTDAVDFYSLTAQSVAITSFTLNLTGTPTEAQKLWVAITGTATRAITWGAAFESGAATLPLTTIGTARLDIGFVWNSATSLWRCMAAG